MPQLAERERAMTENTSVKSVEEARDLVFDRIRVLPAEDVSLLDALGRVLASDAVSDIDVAPFDNSAMDGFAVRAADLAGANAENPVSLTVVAHIAAGDDVASIVVGAGRGGAHHDRRGSARGRRLRRHGRAHAPARRRRRPRLAASRSSSSHNSASTSASAARRCAPARSCWRR